MKRHIATIIILGLAFIIAKNLRASTPLEQCLDRAERIIDLDSKKQISKQEEAKKKCYEAEAEKKQQTKKETK